VSKLMTNNPILMDITVVNARPYLQKEQTDVVIPNLDTPILAGSNEYAVADDDGIIAKVLQTSQEQSDRLKRASGNLVKYYIPLPQERVLMVVINHGEAFENTLVIVVITGLAFLVAFLVIFLMIRSIARNRLKPLGEIGRFIDVVSKGDFGGTLDVKGDNEFGLIAARIKQMALKLNLLIDELNAKAEQEIYRMAYYDDLTQLPNRRHFMQTLASRLKEAESTDETFAVMFMDLDGFKEVNDQFGHDVGDLLLQETAFRLQGCLSPQDMIARLGGDEFTVILSNNQVVEGIPCVCRSILDSLQQECVLNSHPIRISVSIGIAVYPFDGLSIYDLLKSADIAMYKAKENGKNNYWTAAAVDSIQETEMNIVKTKVIRQRTGAHVRIE
jgi:diguanylate cyclase (GGDEF)-like protein